MLNLFLEGEVNSDKKIINDVEVYFMMFKLDFSEIEKRMVKLIEEGSLINGDNMHFIDRFGCKLPLDFMSTGCKAALSVIHCGDNIINLLECGINAQEFIVTELKDGSIFIPYHDDGFYRGSSFSKSIDVGLDGYRFTDLSRLNYYLTDERFLVEPDMKMSGVELIK